ncbi:MAG: TolC family outer membrane protein [Proteobacteria bacterium]|jgi:outer membrane protein/protease secretion system outer membrane protein|nr:TolC family outer membrane protein [Pseudomonadota bacterium]
MKTNISLLAAALVGAGILAASPPARADNLLSLYREAVQADAAYLAVQADTKASREMQPQALAQLLPRVSYSGTRYKNTVSRPDYKVKETVGGVTYETKIPIPNENYTTHTYALGLTQPLFRAASFAAWRQSKALVEGADADLLWAEQQVGMRLGSAYFDVLLAEANLEVTKAQRDAYLTQLDYAQRAFQTGAGTRTDIDEARSQLDLAAAQTIEQHYQLNYARDALKAIIDRPLTPLARLNPERMQLARPDPDSLEDWIRKAEEVNPRLIALRALVQAANLQVKRALSGHLPTLDFVAQHVSVGSEYIDTKYTGERDKYKDKVYGLRFDMPLFSGGETASQVRQARAELDKAQQQLEEGRRQIGLMVRKEFDGVAQGVSWVRAYEQAVKSAEQALASTRKGFSGGVRTTLDILISEQNLATARRDLNRGRCQYVLSRLQLLALVGELNEAEVARFNGWLEERAQ